MSTPAATPTHEKHLVELAVIDLVPQPDDSIFLPAIANRIAEEAETTPWLMPELTAYLPELEGLEDYLHSRQDQQQVGLPQRFEPNYPVVRCLAADRTPEKLESPLTALVLAVLARAAHSRRLTQSEGDSYEMFAQQADMAARELASSRSGITRSDINPKRIAFLRAARPAADSLDYAKTLQKYLASPDLLPTGPEKDEAEPPKRLETLLRSTVIPILSGIAPMHANPPAADEQPEDWEFDDCPSSTEHISLTGSADDEQVDDEIPIHTDSVSEAEMQDLSDEMFDDPASVTIAQSIHYGNHHLCELHADVLTPAEAEALIPTLLLTLKKSIEDRDTVRAGNLAILSLMMATGLTRERVALAMHPASTASSQTRHLTPDCNFLISPVLGPRNRSRTCSDLSEEPFRQNQKLAIPIPPRLAEQLRELRKLNPLMAPPDQGGSSLEETLRSVANLAGFPSITIGRLRRYPSAKLFQHSHDLPAVMVLCGDSFGRSLAPLHYVAWPATNLQQQYQSAILPLWDPKLDSVEQTPIVAAAPPADLPRIIGSPHAAEAQAARFACPKVGAAMHAGIPRPAMASLDKITNIHHQMAAHLTAIFIGVVGHRPCQSVFRLTCMDFDPDLELALFRDKPFDAAHITRLVALGTRVSKQYNLYLAHLRALAGCTLPTETKRYIQAALEGKRPLLFGLDKTGKPERWNLEKWRRHVPNAWRQLKANYGRHALATEGREHGIDPEWIAIQMGHYDLVGYPFTPDSPTYPTSLAKMVGPLLDDIFRAHGWRNRRGLAPSRTIDTEMRWEETGPLKLWDRDLKAHQARCKHSKEQFRQHFFAATAQQRHEAESVLVKVLDDTHPELSSLLIEQFNSIRSSRGETLLPPVTAPLSTDRPQKVKLVLADWKKLLNELEETFNKRPSLMIAIRNRLVIGLRGLSKKRCYKGPIPPGHRYHALPEPSPFPRQIFHASRQIHALRRLFPHLKSPTTETQSNKDLWALGKTTLALVIYGQITDIRLLTALLRSKSNIVDRIPAAPGSLMVHTSNPSYSVALHRVAALSYGKWHSRPDLILPSDFGSAVSQIDCALAALLPTESIPHQSPLIALLSTMEVFCRLEQSGFQRHCLSLDSGSVPLTPKRFQEYLQMIEITPKTGSHKPPTSLRRSVTMTELTRQLNILQNLIPGDATPTIMPRTQRIISPGTQRYKPAYDAVANELSQWIDDTTVPQIVRQSASWLRYTIMRPKHRGSGARLAWSTVSDYFGIVKKALRNSVGWIDLNEETDAEDLEACYLRAVEQETSRPGMVALQLMDFHSHLESEFGYEAIDRSLFLPYLSTLNQKLGNVSADVVLPEEAHQIQSIMAQRIESDTAQNHGQNLRLFRQAAMACQLIHKSGARIAEISGLQHRDVILHDAGVYLILRANGYRGMKTPAARRLVPLSFDQHPELVEFSDWIRNERSLLKAKRMGSQFVFSAWESKQLIGSVVLGQLVRSAIHEVNTNVGPHHSRHFNVTEELSRIQLGQSPRKRSEGILSGCPHNLLPRDMAAKAYNFGHRRARTGGRCYFHLPGFCSLSSQTIHLGSEDHKAESAAWRIERSSYQRRKKRKEAPALLSSLDLVAKIPPPLKLSAPESLEQTWTINRTAPTYCLALDAICSGRAPSAIGTALGLPSAIIPKLVSALEYVEKSYGIRLLPDKGKERAFHPRWCESGRRLKEIWASIEVNQSASHLDLIDRISLSMHGKSERKRLRHSPTLKAQIEDLSPEGISLIATVHQSPTLSLRIIDQSTNKDLTREYIWVCAIALACRECMADLV